MKKKIIIVFLVLLLSFFVIDRYLWMPERAKHQWRWERGIGLGDPISYENDFVIKGSSIIFKKKKMRDKFKNINRTQNHSYYFFGCYLGKLYIYDTTKNEMAFYTDE
jgi:hypothetical protein